MSATVPLQVAGTHLPHSAESSTAAQLASVGLRPLSQLQYVPSSSATSVVGVVADAYDISSSGSSTCGGANYGGSLGVTLPALPSRRTREFIPESKKDDEYWMKRLKNNEAAKRSREKRRANDAVMMGRIHELAAENKRLKLELDVLRRQLGLQPTTAESQPPSTAAATAASSVDAVVSDDQRMLRHKVELAPSRYDDSKPVVLSTSSYRSPGALVVDQKPQPEKTYLHHHHHHTPYYSGLPAASEWPPTCSCSDAFSTSSSDARTFGSLPRFCRSNSGNVLPSIGNLCGSAPLQDDGGDGRCVWSSYRSQRFGDRPASCQSPSLVDSSAIVIFSDVSSSGDDSVDEALYGRHVDTLTVRQSVERVADGGEMPVESPLNLSTPSRHQSPEFARHAYRADSLRRQSSVDFAHVAAQWLPSESAGVRQHHGDKVLAARPARFVGESRLSRNGSLDDAPRDKPSSSTSLSSVASVAAWQTGVYVAPPQPSTDGLPLHAPDQMPTGGRDAHCGLPLKVRRKFSASTSRIVVDAPRQAYECDAGVPPAVCQMLPEDHEPPPLMLASSIRPSREWCRSTSTECGRAAEMSELMHRGDEH